MPSEIYGDEEWLWGDELGVLLAEAPAGGPGFFTDGESIADAEARLGRHIGPCQLKLLLLADYGGNGGKTVSVTATRADSGLSEVLTATVPPGAVAGDIVLLRPMPHSEFPSPAWFTDVTAMSEVSGDGFLSVQVVNDGPAWHSSAGVAITHWAYSPFACDVLLGTREPFLVAHPMGLLFLLYGRDGTLVLCTKHHGEDEFRDPSLPLHLAGFFGSARRGCLGFRSDGLWLLSATVGNGMRFWFSRSGPTNRRDWTFQADLPNVTLGSFLFAKNGVLHFCGIDSSGYLVYGWSDTLATSWTKWVQVAPADTGTPPSIWLDGSGAVHVWFSQSGVGKVAISRTYGSEFTFAGLVGP